jgi:hypothetical protein
METRRKFGLDVILDRVSQVSDAILCRDDIRAVQL